MRALFAANDGQRLLNREHLALGEAGAAPF